MRGVLTLWGTGISLDGMMGLWGACRTEGRDVDCGVEGGPCGWGRRQEDKCKGGFHDVRGELNRF